MAKRKQLKRRELKWQCHPDLLEFLELHAEAGYLGDTPGRVAEQLLFRLLVPELSVDAPKFVPKALRDAIRGKGK